MGLLPHKRAPLWLEKGGKRWHSAQPGECVNAFVPWVRNMTMNMLEGSNLVGLSAPLTYLPLIFSVYVHVIRDHAE
eukprot:9487194-Pyramimonas_sp.AAC.1